MKKIHKHAGGIDIGAKKIFVSLGNKEIKIFDTFTEDLEKAAVFLIENNVDTVAMEATGVYWIILFDILEARGLDVWLVDGRSTKQVPGRKTDVKDCQWIQQLHSYGLLNKCFVAEDLIKELRNYQRLREDHIRTAAMHVNHMQKALTMMNIRLKEVISQVHGVSGMNIIRAILKGERDPNILAEMCHRSILKTKKELVIKSLNGHYNEGGLFALEQTVSCYDFYQVQIARCDTKIGEVLEKMNEGKPMQIRNHPRKEIRHNKPDIENMDRYLLNIFNNQDATALPGLNDYTWIQLLGEIGTDLTKWKTEKHFTSWLGLAPKQHQSGKMKRNYRAKGQPKAGLIFKQAATSLLNSRHIALGAFGRKLRSRKGPILAIKAVARKIAELYWKLHVRGLDYVEKGIKAYEERIILNKQKSIVKMAKEMGMVVSPKTAT